MRKRRRRTPSIKDVFWVDIERAERIVAQTREARHGGPDRVRHEIRVNLGIVSAARASERERASDEEAPGVDALVAEALTSLTERGEISLDVGRPPLDEEARPRIEIQSGIALAAALRPVLAVVSSDAYSVDSGSELLHAIAAMSPDAARQAHRALVWRGVLQRAAESGGYVLIKGCAWEVADEEQLELLTVYDSVSGREVPVPPGLGVLASHDQSRSTPAGEAALRSPARGLRLDVLARPGELNDLAPDLLVLLELDTVAIWPSG